MAAAWNTTDLLRILVCTTVCLCLLIVVAVGMYGLVNGKITGDTFNGILTGTGATGLTGVGFLLYSLVKLSLRPKGSR